MLAKLLYSPALKHKKNPPIAISTATRRRDDVTPRGASRHRVPTNARAAAKIMLTSRRSPRFAALLSMDVVNTAILPSRGIRPAPRDETAGPHLINAPPSNRSRDTDKTRGKPSPSGRLANKNSRVPTIVSISEVCLWFRFVATVSVPKSMRRFAFAVDKSPSHKLRIT